MAIWKRACTNSADMSRVLITIPVYNESKIIKKNLEVLCDACAADIPEHDWFVEVADNASDDGTASIVEQVMQSRPRVLLRRIATRGKGGAIRASWLAHAHDQDVLVFMDADLAADVHALPRLIGPIVRDETDLCCGSRFVGASKVERSFLRNAVSWAFRLWQRLVLGLPVKDSQCGFKAASSQLVRDIVPRMRETGFLVDAELLAFANARRFRIAEIPVDWIEHRDASRQSTVKLWRDGWKFLWGAWRIRRRVHLSTASR